MLSSIINTIDFSLSSFYLKNFKETNSFISFLFHGLFQNQEEINMNIVDPVEEITVGHFKQFIEHFLENGYTFISPIDILDGLDPNKKYVLITFDDGYFNNINALPLLRQYKVPAVFFISVNHVRENKRFWWDVVYRERLRQGVPKNKIYLEQESLKHKNNDLIEEYILKEFGEKAVTPISDIDRPFTAQELKLFSIEDYVFIGNHTSNHAVLTNYDSNSIKSEIGNAQDELFNITGKRPVAISYPNGNYSDSIIKISKELGLQLGITVDARKNYLPINNAMKLGRYGLNGKNNIESQCKVFRSDIKLKGPLLRLKNVVNL